MGAQARKDMLPLNPAASGAAGSAGDSTASKAPTTPPPQRSDYSRFRSVSDATDVAKGAASAEHAEAAVTAGAGLGAAARPVSVDGSRKRYNDGLRFDDPSTYQACMHGIPSMQHVQPYQHMKAALSSSTETGGAYEYYEPERKGGGESEDQYTAPQDQYAVPTPLEVTTGSGGRNRDPYSQANFDLSDSSEAAPPVAARTTVTVRKRLSTGAYLAPAELTSEPEYASLGSMGGTPVKQPAGLRHDGRAPAFDSDGGTYEAIDETKVGVVEGKDGDGSADVADEGKSTLAVRARCTQASRRSVNPNAMQGARWARPLIHP